MFVTVPEAVLKDLSSLAPHFAHKVKPLYDSLHWLWFIPGNIRVPEQVEIWSATVKLIQSFRGHKIKIVNGSGWSEQSSGGIRIRIYVEIEGGKERYDSKIEFYYDQSSYHECKDRSAKAKPVAKRQASSRKRTSARRPTKR